MNKEKLKTIIIKPLTQCNCNCSFCAARLELYDKKKEEKNFKLSDWEKIIKEAKELGVQNLHISGGEPTLYKFLPEIVQLGKDLKLKVNLNSNGILLANKNLVKSLKNAGLDSCTISIYSQDSRIHDKTKKFIGAQKYAKQGIKNLQDEKIKTYIQTILTKENMKDFNNFLNFSKNLKVKKLFISYLEGNIKHEIPTLRDIENFKEKVIPKCIRFLGKTQKEKVFVKNKTKLENLFKLKVGDKEIAKGRYNSKNYNSCTNKNKMALILPDGEVHPCNAVEYFHYPTVGNLKESTLKELWISEKWEKIREVGTGWCRVCPMMHHTHLNF